MIRKSILKIGILFSLIPLVVYVAAWLLNLIPDLQFSFTSGFLGIIILVVTIFMFVISVLVLFFPLYFIDGIGLAAERSGDFGASLPNIKELVMIMFMWFLLGLVCGKIKNRNAQK